MIKTGIAMVAAFLVGLALPALEMPAPKYDMTRPEGVVLYVMEQAVRHNYIDAMSFVTPHEGTTVPLSRSDDPRPYLGVPGDCVVNEQNEVQVEGNLVRVPLKCGETERVHTFEVMRPASGGMYQVVSRAQFRLRP